MLSLHDEDVSFASFSADRGSVCDPTWPEGTRCCRQMIVWGRPQDRGTITIVNAIMSRHRGAHHKVVSRGVLVCITSIPSFFWETDELSVEWLCQRSILEAGVDAESPVSAPYRVLSLAGRFMFDVRNESLALRQAYSNVYELGNFLGAGGRLVCHPSFSMSTTHPNGAPRAHLTTAQNP